MSEERELGHKPTRQVLEFRHLSHVMWLRAWCFSLVTWKVPDPICQPGSDHSAEWNLKLRTWPPSESCKSRRGNDSLKDCGCTGNEVVGSEANDIICQTQQDTVAALFPASRKRWRQDPVSPLKVLPAPNSCIYSLQRTGITEFEPLNHYVEITNSGLSLKSLWSWGLLFSRLPNRSCLFFFFSLRTQSDFQALN